MRGRKPLLQPDAAWFLMPRSGDPSEDAAAGQNWKEICNPPRRCLNLRGYMAPSCLLHNIHLLNYAPGADERHNIEMIKFYRQMEGKYLPSKLLGSAPKS